MSAHRGRRRLLVLVTPLLAAAAGCPGTSPYPQPHTGSGAASTGRHYGGSSAGAATGGGSAGASSGTGSGGSSGTGQTTGGVAGVPIAPCDAGLQILGSLAQLSLQSGGVPAPLTVPIQVQNSLDPSQIANTDQQGNFEFCMPPGSALAAEIAAPTFEPVLLATVDPVQNMQVPPVQMIPSAYLPLLSCLSTTPASAVVVVNVLPTNWDWTLTNVSGTDSAESCKSRAGWTIQLTDADGGLLDSGMSYQTGTTCGPGLSTGPSGIALTAVPSELGQIGVRATRANNLLPDGGLLCNYVGADPHFAFTGVATLRAGYLVVVPYVVRAASFSPAGATCFNGSDCVGGAAEAACFPFDADAGVGTCCYLDTLPCTAPSDCCNGSSCEPGPDGGAATCCLGAGFGCRSASDCCPGLACVAEDGGLTCH